ncbi:MAG: sugar ABC transporter ATP-binding protein, partial [Mesorhizobium sp.]
MTSTAQDLHPAPTLEPGRTILELRGLEKRYPGEIHAIVGENGAGKSTLIKLLTGVMPRTSGDVIWEGKPEALATPHEAMALGINAVHQEVVLCRHLTVAANMFLGEENSRFGILQQRAMVKDAQKIIDGLGFDLPAHVMLGD